MGAAPVAMTCGDLCTSALQPVRQFSAQVLEVAGASARQLLAGVVEVTQPGGIGHLAGVRVPTGTAPSVGVTAPLSAQAST